MVESRGVDSTRLVVMPVATYKNSELNQLK